MAIMKKLNSTRVALVLMAILGVAIIAGCPLLPGGSTLLDTIGPSVDLVVPANLATNVVLNTKAFATFSEAMDPSTISTTTFTLQQGTMAITGTVSYTGDTATFTPTADLAASAVFTATVTRGVKDMAGNALAANKVWTFTTGVAPDATPPTVLATLPLPSATGVGVNAHVSATFNEAMDPTTLVAANFTLKLGAAAVAGTVARVGDTMTFTPTAALAGSTLYTATVTTGVKDLAGNALAVLYSWNFTTGVAPDTTPPTVGTTLPLPSATGVAVNAHVSATFSEMMDPLTVTPATFTLKLGAVAVAGTVARIGSVVTFTPTAAMEGTSVYTATITTGAKDLAGNALAAPYSWNFTTGVAPDTTAPTVSSTIPADLATGVDRNLNLSATFNEAMAPLTITTTTVTLKQGLTPVPGTVAYAGTTATFNPTATLGGNTTYTVTITTGAKDLAGNALAADYVWTFTTVPAATGPAPVLLGTSGNYVILAKSAITNVSTSAITGDIGLSPAAQSYITGFALTTATGYATTPEVTGKVYAADQTPPTPAIMTTAISDMELAYTDAAGRPTPDFTELHAGNLGGQTLVAGLYKWAGTVTAPSSFTIDGGANDVWIFQIAGNLTVSNAVIVTLSGGAQAKNIFWQVAGQATLGGTSQFKGIILSQTQITLQTGASLVGRALAQTQVVLQQVTVTGP